MSKVVSRRYVLSTPKSGEWVFGWVTLVVLVRKVLQLLFVPEHEGIPQLRERQNHLGVSFVLTGYSITEWYRVVQPSPTSSWFGSDRHRGKPDVQAGGVPVPVIRGRGKTIRHSLGLRSDGTLSGPSLWLNLSTQKQHFYQNTIILLLYGRRGFIPTVDRCKKKENISLCIIKCINTVCTFMSNVRALHITSSILQTS